MSSAAASYHRVTGGPPASAMRAMPSRASKTAIAPAAKANMRLRSLTEGLREQPGHLVEPVEGVFRLRDPIDLGDAGAHE